MAAASGTSGTSVQWYSGTVVKGTGITLVPFLVGFLSPNPPSTHLRLQVISDRDAGNRAAGPGRHAFRVRLSLRLLGPGRTGSVWIACHGFGFSIYYGGLRLSEASGCQ